MKEFVPLQGDFVISCISLFAVIDVKKVTQRKVFVLFLLYFFYGGHHVYVEFKILNARLFNKEVSETRTKSKTAFYKARVQSEWEL